MKAEKALNAGDLPEARSDLEKALEEDPQSAPAYLMLGSMELQAGRVKEAAANLRQAVRLDPKCFGCNYNLALALLRQTKLQEAALELRRALALNPRSSDAAYNLGIALLDAGHPSRAAVQLRNAWILDQNRPDVAFNLIRTDLSAHEFTQAHEDAELARKIFNSDSKWLASVGQLFIQAGLSQAAVVCLAQALQVNPSQESARRLLAEAYLNLDRPHDVLALISEPSTPDGNYLRSSAYFLLSQPREAQRALNRALGQSSNEPRYLLLGARIDQQLGQYVSALQLLKQARRSAPDWPAIYYSSAVSYYFLHRYLDCRHSLDQALRLDPRFGKAFFLDAVTLVIEGRDTEAEANLQRAIAIEPDNARFRFHLGALLLRENRQLKAYTAFQQAVHLRPDYALAHYELGKIQADINHPKVALSELQKTVFYDPHLTQAYYQLGRVYALLGEKQKSASAFAKFNNLKKKHAQKVEEFLEFADEELEAPSRLAVH